MGKTARKMKTMIEIERNRINEAVNDLTVAAHNNAIEMVIEKLQEKKSQIEKLLDNGQSIYFTSPGDRSRRLYDKRYELYLKKWEIWNTIKMLYNMKMQ